MVFLVQALQSAVIHNFSAIPSLIKSNRNTISLASLYIISYVSWIKDGAKVEHISEM